VVGSSLMADSRVQVGWLGIGLRVGGHLKPSLHLQMKNWVSRNGSDHDDSTINTVRALLLLLLIKDEGALSILVSTIGPLVSDARTIVSPTFILSFAWTEV